MGLWLMAFMVSLNIFVIAVAAVVWYFQQGNNQEYGGKSTRNPCCTGYLWAFGWHMGSIAFGSFILSIVWSIQIVMAYVASKMKGATASNTCVSCMFGYIQYCLACFERCIQFLNKQAYIQVSFFFKQQDRPNRQKFLRGRLGRVCTSHEPRDGVQSPSDSRRWLHVPHRLRDLRRIRRLHLAHHLKHRILQRSQLNLVPCNRKIFP
jgi:hypothetical protein